MLTKAKVKDTVLQTYNHRCATQLTVHRRIVFMDRNRQGRQHRKLLLHTLHNPPGHMLNKFTSDLHLLPHNLVNYYVIRRVTQAIIFNRCRHVKTQIYIHRKPLPDLGFLLHAPMIGVALYVSYL